MCLSCHVVSVKSRLKSLEAIRRACQRLGWTFRENKLTYEWYGQWVGGTEASEHLFSTREEYEQFLKLGHCDQIDVMNRLCGKCDHAISLPNCRYEIGLMQRGEELVPVWDGWRTGGLQNLTAENGLSGFLQAYGLELERMEAERLGYSVAESINQDGSITLTCTSYED